MHLFEKGEIMLKIGDYVVVNKNAIGKTRFVGPDSIGRVVGISKNFGCRVKFEFIVTPSREICILAGPVILLEEHLTKISKRRFERFMEALSFLYKEQQEKKGKLNDNSLV